MKKVKMSQSRISSKHQITIPREAFDGAGLREGDVVDARALGPGRIELTRLDALIERHAGCLPPGTFPPGFAESVRGEWE
jgi:bifunctional DNA-binding transcriptional regulator/antitoxin component of YhaV-PrlF toxin-antitoxin module